MNEKAIFSAIGEILKTELTKRDARIEELAILQAENTMHKMFEQLFSPKVLQKLADHVQQSPEVDYQELLGVIKANTEFVEQIQGDKGDSPDIDDIVTKLKPYVPQAEKGKDGLDGIGIKAIEQSDPESFDVILDNDQTVQVNLPKPLKGETGDKGLQGLDGLNGLDRPVPEVRRACAGLEKGEVVYYNGGLYQATKKTVGTPDDDASAYRIALNGIDKAKFDADIIERMVNLVVRKTDGEQHELSIDMPAGYVADPKVVSRFFKGDYTFEGTKLKKWDGEAWQEHQLRGAVGRKGSNGVGIKDVSIYNELLRVKTTSGEVYDLPIVEKVAEFIATEYSELFVTPAKEEPEQCIKRFAGQWKAGCKSQKGDIATTSNGMYLALKDTKQAPEGSEDWQLMMPMQQTSTIVVEN